MGSGKVSVAMKGGGLAHLTDVDPQQRLFDVRRGLVVPREESHWWLRIARLSFVVELGEDGLRVVALAEIRWVLRRCDDEEMITEKVVNGSLAVSRIQTCWAAATYLSYLFVDGHFLG